MNDSTQTLRDNYYESLLYMDIKEFKEKLPEFRYATFEAIIYGLMKKINERIEIFEEEIKSNMDFVEYVEELKIEIKSLQEKMEVCKELVEQYRKVDLEVEEEKPKINLVFATTKSGNICFENDLKNIPEEYYDSVIESLKDLQQGGNEKNKEKGKKLTNNKGLKNVHEVKDYQIRIVYKPLSADSVYVTMLMLKKTDFGKTHQKEIDLRTKLIEQEYTQLKKDIQDLIKKEEIIAANQEILVNIYDTLKGKRRGK